jgi:hypothetical protein
MGSRTIAAVFKFYLSIGMEKKSVPVALNNTKFRIEKIYNLETVTIECVEDAIPKSAIFTTYCYTVKENYLHKKITKWCNEKSDDGLKKKLEEIYTAVFASVGN